MAVTWNPGPAGTPDDDVANGDGANDTIDGLSGDDTLNGAGGNDTIDGGTGNDSITGGQGDDSIDGEGDIVFDGQVTNGNFSSGGAYNPTGWTLTNNGGADFGDVKADNFHNGFFGGNGRTLLWGAGNNAPRTNQHAIQTVNTTAGQDYRLNYDVGMTAQGNTGGTYSFRAEVIDVATGAVLGSNDITLTRGQKANIDIDYKATGAQTRLVFRPTGSSGVNNANTDLVLDNVSNEVFRFDDTIDGEEGDDYIDGNLGNDSIDGGEGVDTILGGDGNDTIVDTDGTEGDSIDGGDGNDDITTGTGEDTIDGGSGNDVIDSGDDNDSVEGGSGNDVIDGGQGLDTLNGGTGNDIIDGGEGNDSIDGEDGEDLLIGYEDDDTIEGGSGDDTIFGDEAELYKAGDNAVTDTDGDGAANWSDVDTGSGAGTIQFDTNGGVITFGSGSGGVTTTDPSAYAFRDIPIGNATNMDFVIESDVNNNNAASYDYEVRFRDGDGNLIQTETVTGVTTAGNTSPTFSVDTSGINGPLRMEIAVTSGTGQSNSAFSITNVTADVTAVDNTSTATGDDSLDGESGNDFIAGGAGEDTIEGGTGSDTIDGGADDDTIGGGAGNDSILGDAGNDTITGDSGTSGTVGGPQYTTNQLFIDDNNGDGGNWTETGDSTNEMQPNASALYRFGQGSGGDTQITPDPGKYIERTIDPGNATRLDFDMDFSTNSSSGARTYGWLVEVRDADGNVLETRDFNVASNAGTVNQSFSVDTAGVPGPLTVRARVDGVPGNTAQSISSTALNSMQVRAGEVLNYNDTIDGGDGDDSILGELGDDSILGGTGNDTIDGGNGVDTMLGGDDADTFIVTAGDTVFGGTGSTAAGDVDDFDRLVFGTEVLDENNEGSAWRFVTRSDDSDGNSVSGRIEILNSGTPTGQFIDFQEIESLITTVCFGSEAKIATDMGYLPAGELEVGDLVHTVDAGLQPIR